MLSSLKWLGLGWLSMLGLGLWWTFSRAKKKLAPKQEVEAAVERAKADAVQRKPLPDDLKKVIEALRERGEIN